MMKKKPGSNSIVFSTDPDYLRKQESEEVHFPASSKDYKLRIWLEKKHRGGKEASIIKGFEGMGKDLEELGRILKIKCGTGGSVKDREIIIQGDHRTKLLKILLDMGYKNTSLAGG